MRPRFRWQPRWCDSQAIAAINVWNRMNVTVHTDLPEQPITAG